MKMKTINAILLLSLSTSACAQDAPKEVDDERTGYSVVSTVIMSADENEDGYLSLGELEEFGNNIFLSMDYDDNAEINAEEFFAFDFGLGDVSKRDGWSNQFAAGKRILFALRDRNANGVIDASEQRISVHTDFDRADLNGDKKLSSKEAGLAHTPSLIFKAAKPNN